MTRINLADLLTDQFGRTEFEIATTIDLEQLLDQYHLTEIDLDINDLLAASQTIAFLWHIDDVKQQRPDLDDEQCWEVLKECKRYHDANVGMNWSVIDCIADMLFGTAPDTVEVAEHGDE